MTIGYKLSDNSRLSEKILLVVITFLIVSNNIKLFCLFSGKFKVSAWGYTRDYARQFLYIYTWEFHTDTQTPSTYTHTPFLFYFFLNTLDMVYGLFGDR